MIFASKSFLNLNNLKISRPKVTKNLMNLPKKFCEFPPSIATTQNVLNNLIGANLNLACKVEIHKTSFFFLL